MAAWILDRLGLFRPASGLRIDLETLPVANENRRTQSIVSMAARFPEEALHRLRPAAPGDHRGGLDVDEIEQRIIRAYIRLVCAPPDRGESRSTAILRFGTLDVRLTEVAARVPNGTPSFWIEIWSSVSGCVTDILGCSELAEGELGAAVEVIENAMRRPQPVQWSSRGDDD